MKNKILIWVARVVLTLMFFFLCLIDSENYKLFLFLAALCAGYLTLYFDVNKDCDGKII